MFAAIIKIVTMFIKTNFKDTKKIKKIRNYVSQPVQRLRFMQITEKRLFLIGAS